ncbi:MAG TPA: histidine kinase [Roseiflexaceae bacterium]|nr:histidine kinase [Roseiflexaceae bacterium]
MIIRPSVLTLREQFNDLLSMGFVFGFLAVGVLLGRSYRRTHVAHTRRQMRLIAFGSSIAAAAWLVLRVLPALLGYEQPINSNWIDLFGLLIPLGYLIGGVVPDLYRMDRAVYYVTFHGVLSIFLTAAVLSVVSRMALNEQLAAFLAAVSIVVLYGPTRRLVQRFLPARMYSTAQYEPLYHAASALGSTLAPQQLTDHLCAGVRAAYGDPPIGFYRVLAPAGNELSLAVRDRLTLPPVIDAQLSSALSHFAGIVESRILHSAPTTEPLSLEAIAPGAAVWCPIRHTHGHVLAVLVLGMRGDMDPYRPTDLRELQRLLDAATLAFTNSAAYAEQAQAEQTIRELYQRLQQAQDATARAIAQELHDEVININLRLTIESLHRLVQRVDAPEVRQELQEALAGQQTLSEMLRQICENLYPTGIDDPLGLPAVLRQHVAKSQAFWNGECRLVVENAPTPIAPLVQREAVRIAKEAITNAMKHAGATTITVRLRYPDQPGGIVTIEIHDDGVHGEIAVTPRHWGVRNMHENARSAGGNLTLTTVVSGGHQVCFTFPTSGR